MQTHVDDEDVKSLREIWDEYDPFVHDGDQWGVWKLQACNFVLAYGDIYEVYLDQILNSADLVDVIFRLRTKSWMTNEIIGDLLNALQAIFQPQNTLHTWETPQTINDPEAFLRSRIK